MDTSSSLFNKKGLLQAVAVVVLISLFAWATPLPTRAGPIVVIIAIVAVAAAAGAVYDYESCGVNILFPCPGGNSGAGSGATEYDSSGSGQNSSSQSGSTGGIGGQGASGGGSQNGNGAGGGALGGGANAQACTSAAANSCGMYGTSFLDANGNCPATPPPDSACPVPVLSSFYANPTRVSSGGTSVLEWSVTQATQCSLSGGGLSLTSLGISGNTTTNPIQNTTEYTLVCQNGNGPSNSAQTQVGLIPSYKEL